MSDEDKNGSHQDKSIHDKDFDMVEHITLQRAAKKKMEKFPNSLKRRKTAYFEI